MEEENIREAVRLTDYLLIYETGQTNFEIYLNEEHNVNLEMEEIPLEIKKDGSNSKNKLKNY